MARSELSLTKDKRDNKTRFKEGFSNQMTFKKTIDGVSSFNLENIIGTAVHMAAGWFGAWGIRKAVKPDMVGKLAGLKKETPAVKGE